MIYTSFPNTLNFSIYNIDIEEDTIRELEEEEDHENERQKKKKH
jgi:hypothetical protein